ncbi:YbhB/YbcL family Raf kinase inhibitor-like protein [Lentzea sp. NPDC058450]|uniref:YbhB/YbcL family Raf kinase inhibitor-like protein n=1 Tax=Lentzea sp. NPDC058450 TaxID=3346505 RepID=UPI0036484E00
MSHPASPGPYALAFPAPAFTLTSPDFSPGEALPESAHATEHAPGASPALRWHGFSAEARSFVVTAFDPDAPIAGGLWHWLAKDVPGDVTALEPDAGAPDDDTFPGVVLSNSLGVDGYSGVNPPPGTGRHRLYLCVTALSVATLDTPPHVSPALLQILMLPHTVGRALLTGTSEAGDDRAA